MAFEPLDDKSNGTDLPIGSHLYAARSIGFLRLKVWATKLNTMLQELYDGGGGGGGSTPGTYRAVAPNAGTYDNYDPSGANSLAGYDRVDIDTSNGDVVLNGLLSTGVVDDQDLYLANTGANVLRCKDAVVSSTAANRFRGQGGDATLIGPGVLHLKYYKQTVNRWVVIS